MPRKRWINKNSADTTTFQLVYRAQDDPRIHDDSAPDRTLYRIPGQSTSSQPEPRKSLRITDLEDEVDLDSVRENEGEAAGYGIYYDDTDYDYMQHLREIGDGEGQAHFVDSMPVKLRERGKGKGKTMRLEDALRESSLEDEDYAISSRGHPSEVMGDTSSNFSLSTRPRTYQDMQDVPDDIGGFQPGMDPRLREALQALDDDEYVGEQDEEGLFGVLTLGGQAAELDLDEFEAIQDEDEDEDKEGWESDATERAPEHQTRAESQQAPSLNAAPADPTDMSNAEAVAASAEDGDWLRDFAKFKRDNKKPITPAPRRSDIDVASASAALSHSRVQAPASALYTLGGTPLHNQKRRKGALTNPSTYSMTSSSLARTDGQRLLDDRFDRIEAMYALDEEAGGENDDDDDDNDGGISLASGLTKQSRMSRMSVASSTSKSFADGPVRSDLDGMMDGFLDDWSSRNPGGGCKRKGPEGGKNKRGKNGNEVIGMRMLDEVRHGLGPARVRPQRGVISR